MGPRASRRRVLTILDEDESEAQTEAVTSKQPSELPKRNTEKLKSTGNVAAPISLAGHVSSQKSPRNRAGTKSKVETQRPAKPSGKPIYSFFNATTQRQSGSQPSASPEKFSVEHEEAEAIHDDSGDERCNETGSHTALLKGSSTALAMRKRKLQRSRSFEDEYTLLPPAPSQKFRKAGGGDRVPSFSVSNEDKRPWTEQFAPSNLAELSVHKRKVADVRNWLEMVYRGRRQKVLVLKGAAGTGKTTTIRLLAKELNIDLIEWKDSMISDFGSEEAVSNSARFEDFVGRAGTSAGLSLSDGTNPQTPLGIEMIKEYEGSNNDCSKALLVEEFPNTFSKGSSALQSFRAAIARYILSPIVVGATPTPIVMVISETLLSTNTAAADSFTAHRLLGPELITNPYIDIIEFNAVAPTILLKALETIVVREARKSGRRRTPGIQVLKHLAETGDIRSAVSSLEFLCLRGDDEDTWSGKVTFTKPKTKTQPPLTKSEEEALKLITNRESSLGIFHSVGKIVYNKRDEHSRAAEVAQPPTWLSQHQRSAAPETDVNVLIDELGTDTQTFIAALHENYALSCFNTSPGESLESLVGCMENLSDSDLLSLDRFSFGTRAFSGSATDSLRQDEMCFQVAARGTLFSLPCPVHRSVAAGGNRADAHRMFYPTSLKLWRKREEVEDSLELLMNKLAANGKAGGGKHAAIGALTGGVESWVGNNTFKSKSPSTDNLDSETTCSSSTEVRNEMVLDRLPYLATILSSSRGYKAPYPQLEQILFVTRMSRTSAIVEEDMEPDEGDAPGGLHEQWATDQPDADTPSASRRNAGNKQNKQNKAFENVIIPVGEKFTLDDDDIVDD